MATFDPYSEQVMGLREQQALAQKLRDSGLEAPQGQMVSGHFVAPATTQYLAQALKGYLGGQDVQAAQQGIQNLLGQRQKETADYLAAMPKATTSDMEIRTPETMNQMGPSPLHKQVTTNPSVQDYLAYSLKAPGMDAMTASTMGLKAAELKQAQDARLAERQMALEAETKRDRERAQDRQDLARLTAGLKPAPQEKPLTEFQGKSVTFGTRAAEAHNILNELETNVNPLSVAASRKGGAAVNWALDPDVRKVEQAQRNFVNAVLRQESGASIGPSEFDSAIRQYFPEANDPPEVIAQKRASRELVIKGFARQAGPSGAVDIAEVYNAGAPKLPQKTNESAASNQQGLPNQNDLATAAAAEMKRRALAATNMGR